MFRTIILTLGLLVALPAVAQTPTLTPYDRAIAAGYKALTLCSGLFVAGRTQPQLEALELTGIYPEYDAIVGTLPATVDRARGQVTVSYDPAMPPRFAFLRPARGCVAAPIGADPAAARGDERPPPKIAGPAPAAWPQGDGGIAPRPVPALAKVVADAFTATGRTTGVVIVRDGRVVAERYADGFGPFVASRTWSVAKSITGTLAGIGVARGELNVQAPAGLAGWQSDPRGFPDPRAKITLDNLLRMASGLHSATAGNRTDAIYFGGTLVAQDTIAWPLEAQPGTRFRYANNDILLAAQVVRNAAKASGEDIATTRLFAPLGMAHTVAETDWRGDYILSSQVWSTARDLARLGLLYLNDGVWNGTRILPAGWTKYVSSPDGPQPEGRSDGYGATFWLLNRVAGLPADTYAAFGNRGQFVVIVPSRRTVIVRRGEDRAGAGFEIAKFAAAVLAALE